MPRIQPPAGKYPSYNALPLCEPCCRLALSVRESRHRTQAPDRRGRLHQGHRIGPPGPLPPRAASEGQHTLDLARDRTLLRANWRGCVTRSAVPGMGARPTPAICRAAIRILLHGLSDEQRPNAAVFLLRDIEDKYTAAGRPAPKWIGELRASTDLFGAG